MRRPGGKHQTWTRDLDEALLCVPGAMLAGLLAWSGDLRAASSLELLYLVRMGVFLGGCLGLVWWLSAAVERRSVSVGPWLTLSVWLILAAAPAHAFGAHLGRSDGLRWGDTARDALAIGTAVGLLGLVGLLWWARRMPRRGPAVAAALLVLLLVVDRLLAQRQSTLAPVTFVLATGAFALLLRPWPQRGRTAAIVLPLLGTLGGLFAPRTVAEARRRVVVRSTSLTHVSTQASRVGLGTRPPGLVPSLAAQACAPPPEPALAPRGRNVIVITVDTVRNDDAQATIDGRPVMPNLRHFMSNAWAPPYAITGYPATMMALASAFTGVPASNTVLAEGPVPSIFQSLADEVDEVVVSLPSSSYFSRPSVETLVVQGARRLPGRDGKAQTRGAIEELHRLRAAGASHIFWVHYFEPHAPYRAHPGFDWGDDDRGRYRSELAATDHQLGRLFTALRRGGWFEDSLILVFSDHGESFGEHGHEKHHFHLFPWLVRVPFAMHVPGGGDRRLPPVHLMDVSPSVHAFFGARPEFPPWGRSRLGDAPPSEPLVSEEFPVQVATLEQWARTSMSQPEARQRRVDAIERGSGYASKLAFTTREKQLVVHRGTEALQLFDLRLDPDVEHDLGAAAARASPLFEAYRRFLMRSSRRMGCPSPSP